MTKSRKILFFGNERIATGVNSKLPIFRYLLDSGYNIPALIVSQENLSTSKSNKLPEIVKLAEENNIEILNPLKIKDINEQIKKFEAEAAILVAYGKIIPQSIIDLFPKGIINIHPSRLPAHRGSTPIESVIMNGDKSTAVSLMSLSKDMDAGPVFATQDYDISEKISKQQLSEDLNVIGKELIRNYLEEILDGRLTPSPQSEDGVTYDNLILKNDGLIDWNSKANFIERQVRAYLGWPRSRAKIKDIEIIITEAHVSSGSGEIGKIVLVDKHSFGIYCSEDILVIDKLIPNNRNEMDAKSFLAGYQDKLF